MSLRYAVVYKDDNIFLEIPTEKFKEGLLEYFNKHNDLDKAFDELKKELEQAVRRM